MRPQDIAALFRRHIMAVAAIFILTAGLAYHFEHTTPGYTETGTAAFTLPGAGFFTQQTPLLVMNELMANSVTSPRGHEQVRRAGGTGDYDVALVNLNNEDFPNYGLPYATVTATSPTAAEAQATFSAVMTVLRRNLATLQLQQGARPDSLIELRTIAPSGPVAQTGSQKRALAGLAILALVAAYMTARFLDRRPVRLRILLRRRNRTDTADAGWRVHPEVQ